MFVVRKSISAKLAHLVRAKVSNTLGKWFNSVIMQQKHAFQNSQTFF